jgi:NAD(P)-dependent dehydrogenase (short-subunit alcohol dehydrogenase family)
MRPCKVCEHPERHRIEDALLRRVSCASIEAQFGVSHWSVGRHRQHLGRSVIVADSSQPLLGRLDALFQRLDLIAGKAETAKDWKATVSALREVRECVELLARLTGQMPTVGHGSSVAVAVSVNTGHPANELTGRELDTQIAMEVFAATNGFDAETVERMKRLVAKSQSDDRILELTTASTRRGSDCSDST